MVVPLAPIRRVASGATAPMKRARLSEPVPAGTEGMTKPNSRSSGRTADLKSVEASILAAIGKLSGRIRPKPGSILIRFTDSGEETSIEFGERGVTLGRPSNRVSPIVVVSAPARTIASICNGKKEASKAFLAGGIIVRGDLEYFEALLTDAGLLECNPEAVTRAAQED
jgi:hypothetical protein